MRTGTMLPDGRIIAEGDSVCLTEKARSGALGQLIGDAAGALEKCHGVCGDLGNRVHVRWNSGQMVGVGLDHLVDDLEPA